MVKKAITEFDPRRGRFARFRSRQRFYSNLGRQVAHEKELTELRKKNLPNNLYSKERRAIMEAAKTRIHAVSFGIPKFGNVKFGPCPKKKSVRGIALWCPVLMVHEWGTTKKCPVCFFHNGTKRCVRVCENPSNPHKPIVM